jgi:methylthioribose-1-phosphate isomerase
VFDITPAELIDLVVTERGVVERPCEHGVGALPGPHYS